MYSALYATDCQEKRLLILAITIAESNRGVKNLSYWLPELYKEVIAPAPGPLEASHPGTNESPVITEVFPKMTNFVLEIRQRSGYDQSLSVRPPRKKWGDSPKLCSRKTGFKKIRVFRCS